MKQTDIANLGIIALVIYGTSLHEMGHAFVAYWLGDPTPGRHGRLTFNPLAHLKPVFTAIILPALMFFSGGGLLCMAQTPVDPSRFRRPLRDHALVALAGPLMNFAFAALLIGVLWLPNMMQGHWLRSPENYATAIIPWAAFWNLIMAVFNLLPIPPLDGYWIIRSALPLRWRIQTDALARNGMISLLLALIVGSYLIGQIDLPLLRAFNSVLPPPTFGN